MLERHVADAVKNGWRMVLLGDLINNGVSAGSKHTGLEWGDCMDPMSQVEKAIDVFMPAAKAGLIEMIVGGNHSYRSVKACGLHPEKIIAMMLSIAATGKKPAAILPSIIQRVQELAMLGEASRVGGRQYAYYQKVRGALLQDIAKVSPGTEERWSIPFWPGVGHKVIRGVPVAAYHGKHNKSASNWSSIERVAHGFRFYFTGHNHSLDWHPDVEAVRGAVHEVEFFSCGTYQGYEEYAAVAAYRKTPLGSVLVDYNPRTDKATHVRLD
jgi:hypothetical protein